MILENTESSDAEEAGNSRRYLILVIEDGEIVERGKHEELIAREGRYHQLYTVQARI